MARSHVNWARSNRVQNVSYGRSHHKWGGDLDKLGPFKQLIPSNIKFVAPPLMFPRYFRSYAYCLTGHQVSVHRLRGADHRADSGRWT